MDPEHRRAVAYAVAELPELQDGASTLSAVVRAPGVARRADKSGQCAGEQGEINESESYIDTTFASAKGGGDEIGKTRRGKGVKIMAIVDRHGMPLSVSTHAANHHEVTFVQLSFDFYMIEATPQNHKNHWQVELFFDAANGAPLRMSMN